MTIAVDLGRKATKQTNKQDGRYVLTVRRMCEERGRPHLLRSHVLVHEVSVVDQLPKNYLVACRRGMTKGVDWMMGVDRTGPVQQLVQEKGKFKSLFCFKHLMSFCSVEQNHLCSFGIGHY